MRLPVVHGVWQTHRMSLPDIRRHWQRWALSPTVVHRLWRGGAPRDSPPTPSFAP
jgi:hypothetical protein